MSSNINTAQDGTTAVKPLVLGLSTAPSIIYEWAALIPLVIYLASYRFSYKLVGKTSLTGVINVGIFPKLGVLNGIADLLEEGSDFLDRACSISELRRDVWDVNWGSTFPCANGAASSILTAAALGNAGPPIKMREQVPSTWAASSTSSLAAAMSARTAADMHSTQHRRYQTLHVLRFSRHGHRSTNEITRMRKYRPAILHIFDATLVIILLGAAVVACLYSLFGTMAALLISVTLQLLRRLIVITRPSGYLSNNESSSEEGCMLVATHANASTWYLYTGDRGVIDTLLNKPMIY